MLRRKSNNLGFSLLELIFSVAILSVGIMAVLRAFSFSAKVTGLSCDMVKGVFLAEDKIQELEDKARIGLLDKMPRRAADKISKFKREYLVGLDSAQGDIYKADLGISWKSGKRNEKLDLATLFYNNE